MSRFNIVNLNFCTSGDKQRVIGLDIQDRTGRITRNMMYFTNTENDDDAMQSYGATNRESILNITDNEVIHNLYDIKDVCIKTSIEKISESGHVDMNSTERFEDIYSPDILENPVEGVQVDDNMYILTPKTTLGPQYKTTDLYSRRSKYTAESIQNNEYYWNIESKDINTYLYNNYSDITSTSEEQRLFDHYVVGLNMRGISSNYILEIPQGMTNYNDYESGNIQGETFQTKYAYDAMYDMSAESHDTITRLRDYCGIGCCNDIVYLKFQDRYKYSGLSDTETQVVDTAAFDFGNHFNEISTNCSHATDDWTKTYPYQKIETIDSVNRFKSGSKHKSNMFSIAIQNTGLNDNVGDTDSLRTKKEKIRNDIRNNIREICQNVCPVETQLFDVYFDGD